MQSETKARSGAQIMTEAQQILMLMVVCGVGAPALFLLAVRWERRKRGQ